jgi:hypothetical protein
MGRMIGRWSIVLIVFWAFVGHGQGFAFLRAETVDTPGPDRFWTVLGIDFSDFREPLQTGELRGNLPFLELLYRLDKLPREKVDRWAGRWDRQDAKVGQFYSINGTVLRVEKIDVDKNEARRVEIDAFYRAVLKLDPKDSKQSQPGSVVVLARQVPGGWFEGESPVGEKVALNGLFLGRGRTGADSEGVEPVFAAERIGWFREGILGRLRFDCGLLDGVRDGTHVGISERESFYQLLAAVSCAQTGEIVRESRKSLKEAGAVDSVEPLFNRPAEMRGELVLLRGVVRRAVRVKVGDPDIQSRFGIDHYFELYLYTVDSQGNPLVVCVDRLPPGMATGEGASYRVRIEVAGFFFKRWRYRSVAELAGKNRAVKARLAPLMIGAEPMVLPEQLAEGDSVMSKITAVVVVLFIVACWFFIRRSGRGDRKKGRKSPLPLGDDKIDDLDSCR